MVPIDDLQSLAGRIADRMSARTQRRLWMGAHMRRGDCKYHADCMRRLTHAISVVTAGWVVDKNPESHLKTVKTHLEHGRNFLASIENVQPYPVPDVEPNLALVSKHAPYQNDPYVFALLYLFPRLCLIA